MGARSRPSMAYVLRVMAVVVMLAAVALAVDKGYQRPGPRKSVFIRRLEDLDSSAPEQVHISLVGVDRMRISWITKDETPSTVDYGTSPGTYDRTATGQLTSYRYLIFRSGKIHQAVIGPLLPNTVYYYRCSKYSGQEFSLKTPPSSLPVELVVIGDLGQTEWTQSTLEHVQAKPYDALILPGDLSYADFIDPRWDSFGRIVQPLASQRPWMTTEGNHEIERIPLIHPKSFVPYNARWPMPYEESGSDSNLYYSFDVAGGVHVIMLGSYADFEPESAQYKWLTSDMAKIDRGRTPWVLVIIHAPWYNSNQAHQGEKESVDMKHSMEELLYKARVDMVFAGHVHAYERFNRVYGGRADPCGPIHITIGDGGNREGLAKDYEKPQPDISLFREASFGHGRLSVVNASHAQWTWHRNDNDVGVVSDSIWVTSLSSDQRCRS